MGLFSSLKTLFSRRSIENPAYPLTYPTDDGVLILGGGSTASGVRISERSAKQLSTVWRAVSLISGDVAKLPVDVFRRNGEGKARDTNHPAYRLIKWKPNLVQNSFQFRMLLEARALLLGNGYAWILRDGSGTPTDLIPLPTTTRPKERVDGDITTLTYETEINRKIVILQPGDVIHIRGIGGSIEGDSVIQQARDSLGEGLAMQQYSSRFFANDASPSVVLEHPGRLSEEAAERLKSKWKEKHSGISKAHSVAVLQEGMKAHPWSVNMRDAEFIAGRKLNVREIANWFGVPPHKLGDESRTAFASLEQENQSYLDDALDPWLTNWEHELRDKLLSESEKERDTHFIEFNRNALVRADLNTRFTAYNTAIMGGWMSRDEARNRENMNPIPEGEGSVFLQPLNMVPVGQDPPDPTSQPSPDPPQENNSKMSETHIALIRHSAIRACRRLVKPAEEAAKRPDRFLRWLDRLENHRDALAGYLGPSVEATNVAMGTSVNTDTLVGEILRQFHARMLTAAEVRPDDLRSSVKSSCEAFVNEVTAIVCEEFDE